MFEEPLLPSPLEDEDVAVNPAFSSSSKPSLFDIVEKQISRRSFLKTGASVGVSTLFAGTSASFARAVPDALKKTFDFEEISHGVDENIHIPKGYVAKTLIRWGDPIKLEAPEFNAYRQKADDQEKQFGFNNDFVGFIPLPLHSKNPTSGLLCVNHEYPIERMMFSKEYDYLSRREKTEIVLAALGNSIVEINKDHNGSWTYQLNSPFNRRITLRSTKIAIDGPAKGAGRMKTKADPLGEEIIGTFQNCAGGITPWGTYLTCEENINYGFGNYQNADKNHPEIKKAERFGISKKADKWYQDFERFDLTKEPNEINRFGWVVEIDPLDPLSKPVKHTALGRFKHEGCSVTIDQSGHAVAYMGDDQYFEYIYKFVSKNKYQKAMRKENFSLLSEGTLYAARFYDQGKMEWLPLIYGKNGLDEKNGFTSQADVVIDARIAADIVGATPMDRPEDVEIDPITQKIYVSLTNNAKRTEINIANPLTNNLYGHIIEIDPNKDHLNKTAKWDILLMGERSEEISNVACPDNLAFDSQGRFWVATDQGKDWKEKTGYSDGLYGVETSGPKRGQAKLFFRSPVGAETTGICFTPDAKNLFLSVQHPSADATENWEPFGKKSTFDEPATRWPDFRSTIPPRPSVVMIKRKDGKEI